MVLCVWVGFVPVGAQPRGLILVEQRKPEVDLNHVGVLQRVLDGDGGLRRRDVDELVVLDAFRVRGFLLLCTCKQKSIIHEVWLKH